jgi:hypothetical protein
MTFNEFNTFAREVMRALVKAYPQRLSVREVSDVCGGDQTIAVDILRSCLALGWVETSCGYWTARGDAGQLVDAAFTRALALVGALTTEEGFGRVRDALASVVLEAIEAAGE